MMRAHAFTVPDGAKGFDCNQPLGDVAAQAMLAAGYGFAIRYIPRETAHSYDLSPEEVDTILHARLGLMPVQHVKSAESWIPTGLLGTSYGLTAVHELQRVGIGLGVCVWLDLEGVAVGTPAQDVINYCNNWHAMVAGAGYIPGLYIGWHCGLTALQLYRSLRFSHYWAAYNLNADKLPIVRGVQMRQGAAHTGDVPHGLALTIDIDIARADALGGRAIMYARDDWR